MDDHERFRRKQLQDPEVLYWYQVDRWTKLIVRLTRLRQERGLTPQQMAVQMRLIREEDMAKRPWTSRRVRKALREIRRFERGEMDPSLHWYIRYVTALGDDALAVLRLFADELIGERTAR